MPLLHASPSFAVGRLLRSLGKEAVDPQSGSKYSYGPKDGGGKAILQYSNHPPTWMPAVPPDGSTWLPLDTAGFLEVFTAPPNKLCHSQVVLEKSLYLVCANQVLIVAWYCPFHHSLTYHDVASTVNVAHLPFRLFSLRCGNKTNHSPATGDGGRPPDGRKVNNVRMALDYTYREQNYVTLLLAVRFLLHRAKKSA